MKTPKLNWPFLIVLLLTANLLYGQKSIGLYAGSVTNKFEGDRVTKLFEVGFRMSHSVSAGFVLDIPIRSDVYITFIPGYKNISGTIYEANEEYNDQIDQGIEEPTVPKRIDISTLKFQYAALPVLVKIISDNKRWQFMAGLEPAWNFSSQMKDLDTGEQSDIKDVIRNINLSAIFGFGYKFKIKKARFSFDLMYTQGLLNMSSGQKVQDGIVPRVKSTTGETRLTWYFINKKSQSK